MQGRLFSLFAVLCAVLVVPAVAPVRAVADDRAIERLEEENTRLRNALEQERRSFEDRAMRLDVNAGVVSELEEKIRLLEVENQKLRTAPPHKNQPENQSGANQEAITGEAERELAFLRKQLETLERDNDRLKREVATPASAAASGRDPELDHMTRRFQEAEREIVRLGTVMEQERARWDQEKRELEQMLFDPRIADDAQVRRLKTLESDLAEARKALDEQGKTDRTTITTLERQTREMETRLNTANAEIARLKTLETELASTRRAVEEKGREAQSAATTLERRTQELESQLASANAEIARLKPLETELANTRRAVEEKGREAQSVATTLERRTQELESQLASANAEIARLKPLETELASTRRAVEEKGREAQSAATTLERRTQELESQLASANAEIARLKPLETELANTRRAVEDKTREGQMLLTTQESRVRELESRLSTVLEEGETLRRQLATANVEVERLRNDMQSTEQASVRERNDQANLRIALDTMRQEVESLNRQIQNLEGEKNAMNAQLARANADMAAMQTAAQAPMARSAPGPSVEVDRVSGLPGRTVSAESSVGIPPVSATTLDSRATSASASGVRMMTQNQVEALLKRAGVDVPGGVQAVASASGPGRAVWRWQAGGLYGTAEQRVMESPAQFDRMVKDYLDRTRARCGGQFAAVPAVVESRGDGHLSSYEIACVDHSGSGSSAALIFNGRGQVFTTIAHEATPESMDFAMDARDRILSALR